MDEIVVKDEMVEKEDGSDNKVIEPIEEENKKCMLVIPKTSFNKDKTRKDGHHSTCRLCEKEAKKQYMLKKQETLEQITEKQCKMCNETKDISNFSKHLYNKDGYVNFAKRAYNRTIMKNVDWIVRRIFDIHVDVVVLIIHVEMYL